MVADAEMARVDAMPVIRAFDFFSILGSLRSVEKSKKRSLTVAVLLR